MINTVEDLQMIIANAQRDLKTLLDQENKTEDAELAEKYLGKCFRWRDDDDETVKTCRYAYVNKVEQGVWCLEFMCFPTLVEINYESLFALFSEEIEAHWVECSYEEALGAWRSIVDGLHVFPPRSR